MSSFVPLYFTHPPFVLSFLSAVCVLLSYLVSCEAMFVSSLKCSACMQRWIDVWWSVMTISHLAPWFPRQASKWPDWPISLVTLPQWLHITLLPGYTSSTLIYKQICVSVTSQTHIYLISLLSVCVHVFWKMMHCCDSSCNDNLFALFKFIQRGHQTYSLGVQEEFLLLSFFVLDILLFAYSNKIICVDVLFTFLLIMSFSTENLLCNNLRQNRTGVHKHAGWVSVWKSE